MNQGKIILNINVDKKIYTIFFNKQNNLNAYAIEQDKEPYFVKDINELNLLNRIIAQLNKRYIRRKNVFFEGEELTRFENKYNHLSYFAKKQEDGTLKECEYANYKKLYEEYNGLQVSYLLENDSLFEQDYGDFDGFDDLDSFNDLDTFDDFDSFDDLDNIDSQDKRSTPKKKDNGLAKKIAISVAGVLAVAGITFAGWNLLQKGRLPEVTETPEISSSQAIAETREENDSGEDFADTSEASNTIADTEDKKSLERKYKRLEENFRKAGLQNWEISQQLEHMAALDETEGDISFYYDTDSDSIKYIYDTIIESSPEETEEVTTPIKYSEKVQLIIDTINDNSNLSENEKKFVIDNYAPIWQKNEKYINPYEIASRYKDMSINFEYVEGGKDIQHAGIPFDKASGTYEKYGKIVSTPEELEKSRGDLNVYDKNYIVKFSQINIYDSNNLEETLENSSKTKTLLHELNHVNGNFEYYRASLLNEGYTQLSSPSKDDRYRNEQFMNIIFIETFGPDTIKEGYYGFDLEQALTNKVVEKTGRNQDDVRNEIYEFLNTTQELLYDLDKNGYNQEIASKIEKYFKTFSNYYKQINGKEMEKNQIINSTIDFLSGSHKANIYTSEEEKISEIEEYDVDTGKIVYRLEKKYDNVPSELGMIYSFYSNRKLTLDDSNKYNENFKKVEDKDIEYLLR